MLSAYLPFDDAKPNNTPRDNAMFTLINGIICNSFGSIDIIDWNQIESYRPFRTIFKMVRYFLALPLDWL